MWANAASSSVSASAEIWETDEPEERIKRSVSFSVDGTGALDFWARDFDAEDDEDDAVPMGRFGTGLTKIRNTSV